MTRTDAVAQAGATIIIASCHLLAIDVAIEGMQQDIDTDG